MLYAMLKECAKTSTDNVKSGHTETATLWSCEANTEKKDVPDLQRRQLQVHALDARVVGGVLERVADLLQRVAVAQQARLRLPNLAAQLRDILLIQIFFKFGSRV